MTFLKNVLSTLVGLFIYSIITFIFFIVCIVGMAFSSDNAPEITENTVFVMKLNGTMEERVEEDPLNMILGNGLSSLSLEDIKEDIQKAKNNKDIAGIFLDCGTFSPDSYASLEEIRRQLIDFKKGGKWIIAYSDMYTTATYYLASVADKVLLNESGMIDIHGMAAEPMFLKDALAKFGVKMTVTKVGKYKSAPEMFTATGMSEPNREQVTAYVKGIWENTVQGISESRMITTEKINALADSLIVFSDPQTYVDNKLVDQLVQKDEVKNIVKKQLKIAEDENINTVSIAGMNMLTADESGDEIAVYYAYGDIVDELEEGLTSGNQIVGDKVAEDLLALADDDVVKAVVLRVNSGGGSAFASEKMWQAVKKLRAKKPVVVSMGGMAASGGYYMSCMANWIVAEKTTLTGSIGIFGMFPDFSQLLTEKIGIKYDHIKTNLHSDFGTTSRPINNEEMAILDKYITRGYDQFLSRVAEGRKMTKEQVNEIAQGRVWLGQDAIKIKLVDEIGGLDVAINKAATLAKASSHYTVHYPAPEEFSLKLFMEEKQNGILDGQLKNCLGEFYEPFMIMKNINQQNRIQARMPYILNIR